MQESFVARSHIRATVKAEITKLLDDVLAKAIGTAIGELMREVEDRFAKKLEDVAREFCFKGTWSGGMSYKRGNFVSMGGQLYHANFDNRDSRPGSDGSWSLAVRSGRDGRDGKDATPPEPPIQRTTRSHR
jgi:hypothetical protein